MERKDFLKNSFGLIGFGSAFLTAFTKSTEETVKTTSSENGPCTVTDSETDGAYPLYNSRGSSIQRLDITNGKTGIPLNINISIRNVNNDCGLVSNGQVKFGSIYPGWYAGRVTHIHAQVHVDDSLKLTTQIAFPEEINTAAYNCRMHATHGQNPTKNTTDNITRDSLDNELATVTANSSGGYDLVLTIYIYA